MTGVQGLGNGKAIALGEPEGLVKTVFDAATGELLGAHMVGAEVTELIQGFAVAKTLETTASPNSGKSSAICLSVTTAPKRTSRFSFPSCSTASLKTSVVCAL